MAANALTPMTASLRAILAPPTAAHVGVTLLVAVLLAGAVLLCASPGGTAPADLLDPEPRPDPRHASGVRAAAAGAPTATYRADDDGTRVPLRPAEPRAERALAGVVIDEFEQPVESFRVVVVPADTDRAAAATQRGAVFGFDRGHFALRGVGDGPHMVLVRAEGFVPAWLGPVTAAAPVCVRLLRPAAVHGRVLAPDGEPIAGIDVSLRRPEDGAEVSAGVSGRDGKFLLAAPAPADYLACAGGRIGKPVAPRTGAPAGIDLIAPRGVTVLCEVIDERRLPVAGATVELALGATRRAAVTDAQGRCRWPCVPAGVHEVTASARGLGAQLLTLDTRGAARDTASVHFELARSARH